MICIKLNETKKLKIERKKFFTLEISTFIGIDQIPLIRELIYLFM